MTDFQTLTPEEYAKLIEAKRLADETKQILRNRMFCDVNNRHLSAINDLYMEYKP